MAKDVKKDNQPGLDGFTMNPILDDDNLESDGAAEQGVEGYMYQPHTTENREDNETMAVKIVDIKVDDLKPHPENEVIYGQEDVSDLVEKIRDAGRIIERLIITKDNVIISGHRRWAAAKELSLKTVPCEVMELKTDEEILEELVLRNARRTKTTAQRIREGMILESVYSDEARERRLENLKQNQTIKSDVDDSASSGATRDKVAKKAGISSGKTYERGKKVLVKVDELREEGKDEIADLLLFVLNKSASAAEDLLSINFEKLTEEEKQGLKSGKIAPRSLVPRETKGKETKSSSPLKSAANEVDAISKAVMNLNKIDLEKVSDKNKMKIHDQIQSQLVQLQELMSKLESKEE